MSSKGRTSALKHGVRRVGEALGNALGGNSQAMEDGSSDIDSKDIYARMDAEDEAKEISQDYEMPPPADVKMQPAHQTRQRTSMDRAGTSGNSKADSKQTVSSRESDDEDEGGGGKMPAVDGKTPEEAKTSTGKRQARLKESKPSSYLNTSEGEAVPGVAVVPPPSRQGLITDFREAEQGSILRAALWRSRNDNDISQQIRQAMGFLTTSKNNVEAALRLLERPVLQDGVMERTNMPFMAIFGQAHTVTVVHSTAQCILPATDSENDMDGRWTSFEGDRTFLRLSPTQVRIHDPSAWLIDWTVVLQSHELQLIPKKYMKSKDTETAFLVPASGVKKSKLPLVLPIPWTFAAFIMQANPTPIELYAYLESETKTAAWRKEQNAKELYLAWARAAAGASLFTNEDNQATWEQESAVAWPAQLPTVPNHTYQMWAAQHLNTMFPTPETTAGPAPPPVMPPTDAPPTRPDGTLTGNAGLDQILTRVLDASAEATELQNARAREQQAGPKAKELDEVMLCNILGWAHLTWEDKDMLPSVWTEMAQKASKELKRQVLRNFFSKDPRFAGFENRLLWDHLIAGTLAPGITSTTWHHGTSLLALLQRSLIEQQQEAQAQAILDGASVLTTADMAKLASAEAPPLPTTYADFVELLEDTAAFYAKLLTETCDIGFEIGQIAKTMRRLKNHFRGQDHLLVQIIPPVAWAIIKDQRAYFTTFMSKDDLMARRPRFPESNLAFFNSQLIAGQAIQHMDLPGKLTDPFRPKYEQRVPADRGGPKRQHDSDGDGPALKKTTKAGKDIINTDQPPVFKEDRELQALLRKYPKTNCTLIAKAGGYKGFAEIPRGDLDQGACGRWIVIGVCQKDCFVCKKIDPNAHKPASECSEAGCKTLLGNMRNGIQTLLANNGSLPKGARA